MTGARPWIVAAVIVGLGYVMCSGPPNCPEVVLCRHGEALEATGSSLSRRTKKGSTNERTHFGGGACPYNCTVTLECKLSSAGSLPEP